MVEYLYIDQGQGGVFTSPFETRTPPLTTIGTHSCHTCVCAYIPISKEQCFIAHIDGHIYDGDDENKLGDDSTWIPTDQQGAALKAFTMKVLKDRVPELANGRYSAKDGKMGAIVICPYRILHRGGAPVHATGFYIVQAINEYFNLRAEDLGGVTESAHGFVVDQSTGEMKFLNYTGASVEELLRHDRHSSMPITELTRDEIEAIKEMNMKIQEEKAEDYGFKNREYDGRREWTFQLNHDSVNARKAAIFSRKEVYENLALIGERAGVERPRARGILAMNDKEYENICRGLQFHIVHDTLSGGKRRSGRRIEIHEAMGEGPVIFKLSTTRKLHDVRYHRPLYSAIWEQWCNFGLYDNIGAAKQPSKLSWAGRERSKMYATVDE